VKPSCLPWTNRPYPLPLFHTHTHTHTSHTHTHTERESLDALVSVSGPEPVAESALLMSFCNSLLTPLCRSMPHITICFHLHTDTETTVCDLWDAEQRQRSILGYILKRSTPNEATHWEWKWEQTPSCFHFHYLLALSLWASGRFSGKVIRASILKQSLQPKMNNSCRS